MPRSRSHSTSSLPGNLMASWSIQSYPASRVEDAVEDLPSEVHYSTAVQLMHEEPTEEMGTPPVSSPFQSVLPPVLVDSTITQENRFPSFGSLQNSLPLSTMPPPSQDVSRRNFSNGCLPNEVYHLIIDFLADNQRQFTIDQTLFQCLLVCKTWSQRATKYFNSRVTIKSPKQLLQYSKAVKSSFSSALTLSLNLLEPLAPKQSCSIIGSTLLLISSLPNLQQLDMSCTLHNDHHPKALRILPNTSVKVLKCIFFIDHGAFIRPILEFVTHFQAIHHLSLTIIYTNTSIGSSLKIRNPPFQRAPPKTKICLKELHLDLENHEIFKLVVNAFMGAKDFASHIRKYSHKFRFTSFGDNTYSNASQELLLHCNRSLQVLSHRYSPSSIHNQCSLHGLNNLRKLQYEIDETQLSETHWRLRTVSSSLISEVNFTYYLKVNDGEHREWGDIDHFMIQNFPALVIVTMTWFPRYGMKITWDNCVSRSVKALPKLHQKGILRPLLPPPGKLK